MPPVIITGSFNGAPPIWFSGTFMLVGLLAMAAGLLGPMPSMVGKLIVSVVGALFFGAGYGLYRARMGILRSVTPYGLAKQMGVSEEALREVIQERGIEPLYIVNGAEFYDPTHFGDAALLLRAAGPGQEKLLRVPERQGGADQNLLQPAAQPDAEDILEQVDGGASH